MIRARAMIGVVCLAARGEQGPLGTPGIGPKVRAMDASYDVTGIFLSVEREPGIAGPIPHPRHFAAVLNGGLAGLLSTTCSAET